jgi:hypothetical protein
VLRDDPKEGRRKFPEVRIRLIESRIPRQHVTPSSSQLRLATFNLGLGFSRKLPDVLDRCLALSLDVIALQEIGDPALTRTIHSQYLFIASRGPSPHDSGFGLLIAHDLAPRCRAFKRSSSGRHVGVILELTTSAAHRLRVHSNWLGSSITIG